MENKAECAQQMYWIHERGVIVTLPEPITHQISGPIARGDEVNPLELHRLSIISNDSIMRKRFPKSIDGFQYMPRVDLEWRQKLLEEAKIIAEVIRCSVIQTTGATDEDFAIIVFGSIARGLTKNRNDEDPSNIDLSIIGDFCEEDRTAILNRIRPARDEGEARIGNNVGVFVQTPEKVTKNQYASVLQFIGACAYPLHDPGDVWGNIEREALQFSLEKSRQRPNGFNRVSNVGKQSRLILAGAV